MQNSSQYYLLSALLFHVCIHSSIHATVTSLHDCTNSREVSNTPVGRVDIPACSSRPREENDADCELFMWLSVEDDTVGAVSAQRHPSRPCLPSVCNSIRVLAIMYCVQRAYSKLAVLAVQLVRPSLTQPVLRVTCHYSSDSVVADFNRVRLSKP